MSVTAGTALIDVKPSMRSFPGELSRGSVSAGRKAGSQMGKAYGQSAKQSSAPLLKSLATGFVVTAGATKTVEYLKNSVDEASDLQQSVGGVGAVFKKDVAQIEKSSRAASQALGLSRNEYNELASTLGSTLKNKGIKAFTADTQKLIGVGADLSAQFGGSTQDAVNALSSAMRGEMDPIERYGVTLNQASLEAEAYSSGIVKRTKDTAGIKAAQNKAIVAQRDYNSAVKEHGKNSDEAMSAESRMIAAQSRLGKLMEGKKVQLTDQQKAQAALSLITKQSADAQGAFGREADTLAGKRARLSASWTNLSATLGTHLLPLLTKGTGFLNDFFAEMESGEGAGGELVTFFKSLGSPENKKAFEDIGTSVKSLFSGLASGTKGEGPQLTGVLNGAATAVRFLAEHVDTLVNYAPAFLGLLAGYKLLQGANNLLGRQSAIGMGLQVTSTLSLAASNRALAASQKAVAVSTGQATAAEKVGLLTRIRTRVATIASTIAEMAATAAKKAGAIATRVLNAVMRMNPLGIVITALTALGVGLVIAYKKSDTFRRIVDGAFSKVRAVASSVVGWFRTTAWPWLSTFFTGVGTKARALYTRYIGPAFSKIGSASRSVFGWIRNTGWPWMRSALGFIGSAVRTLWSKAIKPYFGFFLGIYKRVFGWLKNTGAPWAMGALRAIGGGAKTLWTKWISPYFSRVRSGAGKLVDAFRSAKNGIGKAWGGLKDAVSKPIITALGWVNRYFIGPINSMLSKVGASFSVPKINVGGQGQKGYQEQSTRQRSGDAKFNTGGTVKGRSPHKRADNIRAWLTAGEFVQPVDTVRHYGSAAMEAVRQRKADIVPRYATGGLVYQRMASWLKKSVPGAVITSTNGGGHAKNSYHYQNKAIDIGGPPDIMRAAASAIQKSFGTKILELIHNPGYSVKNGKRVSPGFWGGGTWAGHANHVHWAMNALTGGASLGGGMLTGLAKKVLDQGKGALDALLTKAPKGMWGSAMVGVGKKMTQSIYDKVIGSLEVSGDTSAPGGGVERWRSLVVKALGMVGQPTSLANVTLRRMMQESGGNARAINNWDSNAKAGTPSKGLMQVIGPTFRAYAMKGFSSNVYDPLSNILASMRYAISRYGSLAKAYNKPGGYTSGTHNASPGPHWVGEHGREIVWFRGGERVTSNTRSQQIASRPAGPQRIYGELKLRDGRAYIEGIAEDVFTDMNDGALALAGMGRG